jgi:hypothetical protein
MRYIEYAKTAHNVPAVANLRFDDVLPARIRACGGIHAGIASVGSAARAGRICRSEPREGGRRPADLGEGGPRTLLRPRHKQTC